MNKRGVMESFEAVMWVSRCIFLIVVIFSVMLIVSKFVVTEINVQGAESAVLVNRILYAGLFSAEGGVQNGVVNEAVLAEGELSGIDFSRDLIAAKVSVDGKGVVYNEKAYKKWKVMADAGLTSGAGGVMRIIDRRVAFLGAKPVGLVFDVLTPNS